MGGLSPVYSSTLLFFEISSGLSSPYIGLDNSMIFPSASAAWLGCLPFLLPFPFFPLFLAEKGVPGVDVSVCASLLGGPVLSEGLAAPDVADAISICQCVSAMSFKEGLILKLVSSSIALNLLLFVVPVTWWVVLVGTL